MAKKEKTPMELTMDFMTKIKNVFKKDIVIVNCSKVYAGKLTDEELCGDIMCEVEPSYIIAMSHYFKELLPGKDISYILVDNVAEFKKEPENHCKVLNADAERIKNGSRVDEMFQEIDSSDLTWHHADDQFLLILSGGYSNVTDGNGNFIIIGKSLIPLISEKNFTEFKYAFRATNEPHIHQMIVKFIFTHFEMKIVYNFIQVNNEL